MPDILYSCEAQQNDFLVHVCMGVDVALLYRRIYVLKKHQISNIYPIDAASLVG